MIIILVPFENIQSTLRALIKLGIWMVFYLSHDLQGPAVVHGDGLRAIDRDLTVLLWGPQQRGTEHRGQIVQRHFVDALVFGHSVTSQDKNKNDPFSHHRADRHGVGCVAALVPLQVVQQEEEGDQVGLWQGQQQVEHAALLGHAVRQSCVDHKHFQSEHFNWHVPLSAEVLESRWPMPPAKLGYSSSVKRGSGSSRKYNFRVPAMAFTSISLIIKDTSLLSARRKWGRTVSPEGIHLQSFQRHIRIVVQLWVNKSLVLFCSYLSLV